MARGRIASGADPAAIRRSAEILRAGGLVAFPTETVYGLGADVGNAGAVARIFEVKRRPSMDPIIVHVSGPAKADLYGEFPQPTSRRLMERFWPGPLTLVVPKRVSVPDIVTAGLDTVAIRMPAHRVAQALLRATGFAIAAPSANPFGYVSPTEAEHVAEHLGDQVDLILDGGRCDIGVESTVLSLAGPRPCVLRTGGATLEELGTILGRVDRAADSQPAPASPGQLIRHYATRTPLILASDSRVPPLPESGKRAGLLSLRLDQGTDAYAAVEELSPSGDLREAAANLFAALRRLDRLGLDCIVALPLPEEGLGTAIMDRLRRCAAGSGTFMLE